MSYIGFVYMIYNNKNDKKYIGQTKLKMSQRWNQHIKASKSNKYPNNKFYNSIRKYGIENFFYTILGEYKAITQKELNEILSAEEVRLIEKFGTYNNGLNSTIGGDGTTGKIAWSKGKKLTEDHKKHMSESMSGLKHPNQKGKKFTKEHRENMSKSMKNYKRTDEHNQAISKALTGKKLSEETKKKMSKSHKGWIPPEGFSKKVSEALKGHKVSEETRNKLSVSGKGKKRSLEIRQKMSETRKGENNGHFGKCHSEETKKILSEKRKEYYRRKHEQEK
jgi:group I intron endonuclease